MANDRQWARILREAVELEHPYRNGDLRSTRVGSGGVWTQASVLILVAPPEPALLITTRTDKVETHKGQIAFPGGMLEAGENFEAAALRETYEEVGIAPEHVRVVGQLPPLKTVTRFEVTPIVAELAVPHPEVSLSVSVDEIAQTAWIPLSKLMEPGTFREEKMEYKSVRYPIDVFQVNEHRIWGATGTMLRNFVERLSKVTRTGGLVALTLGVLAGSVRLAHAAEPWKVEPPKSAWGIGALFGLGLAPGGTGLAMTGLVSRRIAHSTFITDISNDLHAEIQAGPVLYFGAATNQWIWTLANSLHGRWDFHYDERWTFSAIGGLGFALTSFSGVYQYAIYPRFAVGAIYHFTPVFALRGEVSHEQTVVGSMFSF